RGARRDTPAAAHRADGGAAGRADRGAARPADARGAPPQPAVVPIGERAGLDVVGPPEEGEAAWKAGFRTAYQLTPGKAIGFVKGDRCPEARGAYMRAAHASFDPDGPEFLHTFATDGRRLVGWGADGTYGREPVRNPLTGAVERRSRGRPLWLILRRLGMKPVP